MEIENMTMANFFSNDGRILTPPKELKPLLKGAFPAFFKTLGHIRFFYVADEVWDGKATLVFKTNFPLGRSPKINSVGQRPTNESSQNRKPCKGEINDTLISPLQGFDGFVSDEGRCPSLLMEGLRPIGQRGPRDGESGCKTDSEYLAAIALGDGVFDIHIAGEDFRIVDESMLDVVFDALKKNATANQRRPAEQLGADLDKYPSGIRCDLCPLNKRNNENNDHAGCKNFHVMCRHCYYMVAEGWGETEFSTNTCEGKQDCYAKTLACLERKCFKNCLECGEYRTCGDCGVGHDPGECNLGITAEEVTNLIIPYCEMERLDYLISIKDLDGNVLGFCQRNCERTNK